MKVCEDRHEAICFDDTKFCGVSPTCPLCAARKEIEEWEKEGAALNERIKALGLEE